MARLVDLPRRARPPVFVCVDNTLEEFRRLYPRFSERVVRGCLEGGTAVLISVGYGMVFMCPGFWMGYPVGTPMLSKCPSIKDNKFVGGESGFPQGQSSILLMALTSLYTGERDEGDDMSDYGFLNKAIAKRMRRAPSFVNFMAYQYSMAQRCFKFRLSFTLQ